MARQSLGENGIMIMSSYDGIYLLMISVAALIAVAIWINVKPQPEIKIMEKDKTSDEWWEVGDNEVE